MSKIKLRKKKQRRKLNIRQSNRLFNEITKKSIMSFEKRDDFVIVFELFVIVFLEIFDIIKPVIDNSI